MKTEPRFASPRWGTIVAFVDLILVSAIGLSVLLVAVHANRMAEGDAKYAFVVMSSRLGF